MKFPSSLRTPVGAAGLSALFPGLGQAAAGQPRRGAIVAIPVFAVLGAFLLILLLARSSLFGLAVNQSWLTSLLILDMVALIYHLWAVVDSYLLAGRERSKEQRRNRQSTTRWGTTAALVVIVTAIVGVHGSVAKVDLDWQHSIYCLTAETPCWVTDTGAVATYSAGPGDVAGVDDSLSPTASGSAASARPLTTFDLSSLPSIQTTIDSENWAADGQLNVLLIGADYEVGTSRTGLRPDTMIVLHVDLTSGKAAMIGVPRNNVCVPLPQGIAENYSKGLNGCSPGTWSGYSSGIASAQLNWLANEAWNNPSHFPDPKDDGWRRGSLATMAAVGTLTGLAMDGYVTINIAGLATLIDDLGGIDITVPTKVYDEPCGQKPAWQSAWYTCAPEGYISGTPVFHNGYQVPGDSSNVQRMVDDAASSGGLQSITWCLPATKPTAGCHPKAGTTGTDIAFVIKPGTQHMDGLWAVAYARTRKFSPGGDFGRMARQQLVLKAMRTTFDPCTILPKIPGLVQHLGGALNTDLPITSDKDVKQWINLAQHTLGGNIKTIVLDPTTTGESFIGGYPAIDPTSWAKIKDIVKHSLDDVPSATSSGGGGGGFSC
jgi:anionic cell wall polymer biosynthesis LytR-Cps2A-Psr (LCP) family protein